MMSVRLWRKMKEGKVFQKMVPEIIEVLFGGRLNACRGC
jgi:hypothetical protein